jgi:rod shape-determining protein MreD
MTRRRSPALMLRCLVFLGICLGAVCLPMAPLAPGADRMPPDILFCVAMAWLLRDPVSAPIVIILPAALLADLLLARPLGLGALGLVLATEFARSRRELLRGPNMVAEWILVALLFGAMWLGLQILLRLSFSGGPDLETTAGLLLETSLYYPLISLIAALGMRMFGPRIGGGGVVGGRGAW